MKITKSKRLWSIIIIYGFTAAMAVLAVYNGMENLAISCMAAITVAGAFYLKYETRRPSNH